MVKPVYRMTRKMNITKLNWIHTLLLILSVTIDYFCCTTQNIWENKCTLIFTPNGVIYFRFFKEQYVLSERAGLTVTAN